MGEQVLFTGLTPRRRGGGGGGGGGDLPCVDVHAVLPLLGEGHTERHNVPAYFLRHILGELLLLEPVLVEGGHEVGERARHLELDLQGL